MDPQQKKLAEVGMVLARISNFDNRRLDPAVAKDWKVMLDRQLGWHWSIEAAVEVVLDHFSLPDPPYFTVGLLVDGLKREMRLTPRDIETDVRVAKRLGLIPEGHDRRVPLPVDVARRLADYRAGVNASLPAVEDGPNVSPLQLDVGRRV